MKMMQFPKDEQVRAIIADLGSPTGPLQLAMSSAGKLLVGSLEDLIQPEDYEHANKVLQERGLDGLVLSIAPLLMQIREMDAKEVILVRGILQICIHVMQKAHVVCIAKLNALDPDSKSDIQINPEILSLMYGLANPYSEGLNQECCIFEMVQMYTTDEYIASKSKTTREAFEQDVPGMATLLQFSEALNYLQFLTNNYTNSRISDRIMRSMVDPNKVEEVVESMKNNGGGIAVVNVSQMEGKSEENPLTPVTVH